MCLSLNSIFWNNGTDLLSLETIFIAKLLLLQDLQVPLGYMQQKVQERGRAEENLENMTMSLTAIEYQIYSYVKNTYSNMYMIIAYSLSIYDKRLFQLI